MKALGAALVLGLLCIAAPASAGVYSVNWYADVPDASALVRDIVTDRFTEKFPADDWNIVVVAEFHAYSDGGGVGYAVAGVAPKVNSPMALFPIRRYSSTTRIVNRTVGPREQREQTEDLIRRAVEQLMAACDASATCEVYNPGQ